MRLPQASAGFDVVMGADILMHRTAEGVVENSEIFYLYRKSDAYAVEMILREPNGVEVPWTVSRDVLMQCAIHGETGGEGDFVAEINRDYPLVYLHNDQPAEESLLFHITGHDPNGGNEFVHMHGFVLREPLRRFLMQTLLTVPAGTEGTHYDIDALIKELTA